MDFYLFIFLNLLAWFLLVLSVVTKEGFVAVVGGSFLLLIGLGFLTFQPGLQLMTFNESTSFNVMNATFFENDSTYNSTGGFQSSVNVSYQVPVLTLANKTITANPISISINNRLQDGLGIVLMGVGLLALVYGILQKVKPE